MEPRQLRPVERPADDRKPLRGEERGLEKMGRRHPPPGQQIGDAGGGRVGIERRLGVDRVHQAGDRLPAGRAVPREPREPDGRTPLHRPQPVLAALEMAHGGGERRPVGRLVVRAGGLRGDEAGREPVAEGEELLGPLRRRPADLLHELRRKTRGFPWGRRFDHHGPQHVGERRAAGGMAAQVKPVVGPVVPLP